MKHVTESVDYFVISTKSAPAEIAKYVALGFESRHLTMKKAFLFQREDADYIYIYYRIEKEISHTFTPE